MTMQPTKYHHSEFTDAMIRRAYASDNYQRNAITAVAKALMWPKWVVYRRAVRLGCIVPMQKQPPWSTEEKTLLYRYGHLDETVMSRKFRQHGFQRTPTAIAVMRKRMQIDFAAARADKGIYTSRQLAVALGIDAKAISSWINKGWLRAERRGTQRTEAQHGDHWQIKQKDIRRFVMDYTAVIDFRKIDKFWLVDLLTNSGFKHAADDQLASS